LSLGGGIVGRKQQKYSVFPTVGGQWVVREATKPQAHTKQEDFHTLCKTPKPIQCFD
jgi:hypothetical protein